MNANTNYKTAILEARGAVSFWKEALEAATNMKTAFSFLGEYNKARGNLKEVEHTCAFFRGADYIATV